MTDRREKENRNIYRLKILPAPSRQLKEENI